MSAFGITEQVIAGLIVVAIVAAAGWLRRRRQNASDESMDAVNSAVDDAVAAVEAAEEQHWSSLKKRAHPVLEAIYELTEGNTGLYMDAHKIAKQAGIPYTAHGFDPLVTYLLDERLLQEPRTNTYNLYKITPAGIREVESHRQ